MSKKNQYLFVLLFPIVNALAANTTEMFPGSFLTSGSLRALIIGTFTLFFIKNNLSNYKLNLFILFYLSYFLILSLLSSNIPLSLTLYFKFFLGVIMFPIGYYYFNTKDKIGDLVKSFLIALLIYLVTILISNIFKLGSSDYLADSFYFGTGRVNITKSMLLLILLAPITLHFIKRKLIVYLIYILGLIITLIGVKRSVLLSGLSSILIYTYLNRTKTYLVRGIIYLVFGLTLTILIFPSLSDIFLKRIEARNERIYITDDSLDEEARYNEVSQVINTWQTGSIFHKAFGSELFNDRFFFKTNRILHIDYMILLNGSGIIGIILWFLIFWLIIKEKNKYYKYLKNDEFFNKMNSVFYMFLAAQMLMSISSTIYAIDIRSIIFLYWGAMIGTMKTSYFELKNFNYNLSLRRY